MKLSVEEFENKYWYMPQLRSLAKDLKINHKNNIRKDQLEEIIYNYLKYGKRPEVVIKPKKRAELDTLALDSPVLNFKHDKKTWKFINNEMSIISPEIENKSGSKYWLARWREDKIENGIKITYSDLINEYIRLNTLKGKLPQIPSCKFNNFISDFLNNETGKNRTDALNAWNELKDLKIKKDYVSWKSAAPRKGEKSL